MKIGKEYIVLILLIAALGLYLFSQEKDRTRYELPEPAKVTVKNITSIDIAVGKERSFQVVRKGDRWILLPGDYPADEKKVQSLLDDMGSFTLTALVSESKNYEPYDLGDDRRIRVQVREGEKDVLQVDLGKAASTYRHTFVRIGEDPRVYHARGNLRSLFDKTVDDLRDRKVLSFDKGEITELTVTGPEKKVTLTRTEIPVAEKEQPAGGEKEPEKKQESAWLDETGKRADGEAVDRLLGSLSRLECESYLEGKTKEDFKEPLYTVAVVGPEEHLLSVYRKGEEGKGGYPAVSSQNGWPFILPDHRVDSLKSALDKMTAS